MAAKAQLNIRLSREKEGVLRAVAFVRGISSGELAREIVEAAMITYADRPAVKKAMEAQLEYAAEGEGKLAHLPKGVVAR